MRVTLRVGDLVGPAEVHRGVPYAICMPPDAHGNIHGYFVEDWPWASIPDDTTTMIYRAYLLDEHFDPWYIRVVSARTGKVYRLGPEAIARSEWVRL